MQSTTERRGCGTFAGMSQGAIMAEPPGERRMSLEAWAAMPEDEPGELVDGRIVEEEGADTPHEAVVSWISYRLMGWSEPRNGVVLGSEAKFAVPGARGSPSTSTRYGGASTISSRVKPARNLADGELFGPTRIRPLVRAI